MNDPDTMDYLARVEHAVRNNLSFGTTVLGVIEAEVNEREGFWERMYWIAWQNDRECGTHRVSITSDTRAALFYGHYQLSKVEAIADMIRRAGLEVVR